MDFRGNPQNKIPSLYRVKGHTWYQRAFNWWCQSLHFWLREWAFIQFLHCINTSPLVTAFFFFFFWQWVSKSTLHSKRNNRAWVLEEPHGTRGNSIDLYCLWEFFFCKDDLSLFSHFLFILSFLYRYMASCLCVLYFRL